MTLAFVTFTFVASAALVRAFLVLSRRRLLDQPGARSSHVKPTPTGGGFPAVLVFVAVSCVAALHGLVQDVALVLVAAGVAGTLASLGLLDDVFDLPAAARFSIHSVVAFEVVRRLGHPGPGVGPLATLSFALCVLMLVGLINAFNFMDGIDALVAGTGIVIVGSLALVSGEPLWLLLCSSYAGFLVFNWPPAKIFMGDAGSTVLGGLLGVELLSARAELEPRHALVLLPLVGDAAYTLARRAIRRENVLRAHHSHLYQRLLRAGHSHGAISASYALATVGIALVVILGSDVAATLVVLAWGLSVLVVERYLSSRGVPFTRPAAPPLSNSA